MKVFSINGYYKDDQSEFDGYLVAEFDNTPKGYSDDDIFFYGLSETNLQEAIELKEDTGHDFVITGYEVVDETEPEDE